MFAYIVGNVDFNSALVLCVGFIALTVMLTSALVKWKSSEELQMQFEIDKNKLRNEDLDKQRNNDRVTEYEMAKLTLEKDVQFKRIDSGLIELKRNTNHEG